MKVISDSKISIVDFTPQETKPASAALREKYKSVNRRDNFNFEVWASGQKPPSLGFSLIMNNKIEWHKPSTVVIRNGDVTYLMGQDEGTYFGCQLADNPNSVEEAYLSLIQQKQEESRVYSVRVNGLRFRLQIRKAFQTALIATLFFVIAKLIQDCVLVWKMKIPIFIIFSAKLLC